MTEIKEKDFWEKEHKIMWESFDRLQDEVKQYEFPAWLLKDFEEKCWTLSNFFMGKSFPDLFPPEKMNQLESEVRALGYSPDKGVRNWFKNRKKKKERSFYVNRTLPSSKRKDKKAEEKAWVKRFYENKGQYLEDSQIETPPEDSPVDVIVKDGGKEVSFQVTFLQKEIEGQLLKGDMVLFEVNPEKIRTEIIKIINDKEFKSGTDIILLLCSSLLSYDKEPLERAVAGLPLINSSFRKIYIVTFHYNIPVKTST